MSEILESLRALVMIFTVAGVILVIAQRLRIPGVIALLAAGLLLGRAVPHSQSHMVEALAEIGVVVLLFTVGLEFSLSRLFQMWKVMLSVGVPQVLGSIALTALILDIETGRLAQAIFVGMLVAMSSTAVVIKVLNDRGEMAAPHGRLAVAVLLFQDLLVLVFMLAIPLLSGHSAEGSSPLLDLLKGLGVVALVLLGAKYLLPPILFQVVRTQNREAFLIALVVITLGTAAVTASAGLSLALGAFLAGLALSESEYAHQMMSEVLPFRDTLSSLFFVSVGMLLDLSEVWHHLGLVVSLVAGLLLIKFLVAAVPTWIAGYPANVAIRTATTLMQIGEFSFVLSRKGEEIGLISPEQSRLFLAAAVISMMLTPPLMASGLFLGERADAFFRRKGWFRDRVDEKAGDDDAAETVRDHVVIVGYGITGRNLSRVLKSVNIPYTALDINPERVRRLRREGEPIHYGDCSRELILEHLGIPHARLLVIAISDPASTQRCIAISRQLNPDLQIIARTRFITEIPYLERIGADQIIPEDFVTSLEIFDRVLRAYEVPRNEVLDLIDRVRADQFEVFRDEAQGGLDIKFELVSQVDVEPCLIRPESPAVGRTVIDLQLRSETGATLIALRRDGKTIPNPAPEEPLRAGDIAVLLGDASQVERALLFLDPSLARPRPAHDDDPDDDEEMPLVPSEAISPT